MQAWAQPVHHALGDPLPPGHGDALLIGGPDQSGQVVEDQRVSPSRGECRRWSLFIGVSVRGAPVQLFVFAHRCAPLVDACKNVSSSMISICGRCDWAVCCTARRARWTTALASWLT